MNKYRSTNYLFAPNLLEPQPQNLKHTQRRLGFGRGGAYSMLPNGEAHQSLPVEVALTAMAQVVASAYSSDGCGIMVCANQVGLEPPPAPQGLHHHQGLLRRRLRHHTSPSTYQREMREQEGTNQVTGEAGRVNERIPSPICRLQTGQPRWQERNPDPNSHNRHQNGQSNHLLYFAKKKLRIGFCKALSLLF